MAGIGPSHGSVTIVSEGRHRRPSPFPGEIEMSFPLGRKYSAIMNPVTTVGNDDTTIFDPAAESETVTLVQYIPKGTQAGANTNSRTLNLYNRNATDGTGAVLIATLALTSGVDLTDNVAKTIPLSGIAANLLLTVGQVMEAQSLHVLTGIADPGGRWIVTTTRTLS